MSVTSSVGEEALAAVLGEFWTYVDHRDGQDGATPEDDRHVLFIRFKVLHGEIDT